MAADDFDLDKFLAEGEQLLDEFPYAAVVSSEETPKDVDPKEIGVEISFYLGWAIDTKLVSDKLERECNLLEKFRNRKVPSRIVLRECCDDKLEIAHLSVVGNEFTKRYYRPGWKYLYYQDLEELFPDLEDFAYLHDNWSNFEAVSAVINSRFEEWKKTK